MKTALEIGLDCLAEIREICLETALVESECRHILTEHAIDHARARKNRYEVEYCEQEFARSVADENTVRCGGIVIGFCEYCGMKVCRECSELPCFETNSRGPHKIVNSRESKEVA